MSERSHDLSDTDIRNLGAELFEANSRLDRAIKALAPKHKGGEWEEYQEASQIVLSLERKLAASQGEEYAQPFGFPLKWDAGAPMPHLLMNDHRAFLCFLLNERDPSWDGSYVTVKSLDGNQPESLGLVEFKLCLSAKLGSPNDEVFQGHPLRGKGMEAYGAQHVVNSRWLAELEKINSSHSLYNPASWKEPKHFIFWFHDSTFECIAESYVVETHCISMKEMLTMMVERLIAN